MKSAIFFALSVLLTAGAAVAQEAQEQVAVNEVYVSQAPNGGLGKFEVRFLTDGKIELTINGSDCEQGRPCAAVIKSTVRIIPQLVEDKRNVDGALLLQLTPLLQLAYGINDMRGEGSWKIYDRVSQGGATRNVPLFKTIRVTPVQEATAR